MRNIEKIQTAVIGAGVVGLSCARKLALMGHETLILERSSSIGSGALSFHLRDLHEIKRIHS